MSPRAYLRLTSKTFRACAKAPTRSGSENMTTEFWFESLPVMMYWPPPILFGFKRNGQKSF